MTKAFFTWVLPLCLLTLITAERSAGIGFGMHDMALMGGSGINLPLEEITGREVTGEVIRLVNFPSQQVDSRHVDIWLPPGYEAGLAAGKRYPVLYMHDGQNLYDPRTSFASKVDWGIDESLTRLIEEGRVPPVIVVGPWSKHGYMRFLDYMPRKAVNPGLLPQLEKHFGELTDEPDHRLKMEDLRGDRYLKFLVAELKPFIDNNFATLPDRDHTFVMGSSMGGLISAYAISEYPDVFVAAACLSTHFPAGEGAVIDYLAANLPDPDNHRIYFDIGTETLDAEYEPYQQRMDEVMITAGYQQGKNWLTRKFEGHSHSETDWRQRVHIPLEFLLTGRVIAE